MNTQETRHPQHNAEPEPGRPPPTKPQTAARDPQNVRSLAFRYGSAVLAVGIATLVRLLFQPILHANAPFVFYFLAILMISWYCELGPALLTLVLSVPMAIYFILEPQNSFNVSRSGDIINIFSFCITSLTVAIISSAQHRSRTSAQASAQDALSQQKAAQEAKESLSRALAIQERLAAIVESSNDAIISMDLSGTISSWNPAAQRLYGYSQEEIIGRSKSLLIPSNQPDELADTLRRIQAGEGVEHYETRRVHKDGTVFDVSISVSPLQNEEGQIVGASTIARDITEQKRSEQALRQRQIEIEALNERLRRAMSETHHRVKNNLQVISALVSMQVLQHEETVPVEELHRLNQHIRGLASIHDLLTTQSKREEGVEDISVHAALAKLIPMLQGIAHGRSIRWEVQDIRLPVRQGTTLTVLVNELVSNAIKHGRGEIRLIFEAQEDRAVLRVEDEGSGFPDGFDPVKAAHTGLELIESLAHWDLHGVTRYENREEGGAVVSIEFPIETSPMSKS